MILFTFTFYLLSVAIQVRAYSSTHRGHSLLYPTPQCRFQNMKGIRSPRRIVVQMCNDQNAVQHSKKQVRSRRVLTAGWFTTLWRKSRLAFASVFIVLSFGARFASATAHRSQAPLVSISTKQSTSIANKSKMTKLNPKSVEEEAPVMHVEKSIVTTFMEAEEKIFHDIVEVEQVIELEAVQSWRDLIMSLQGTKLDTLLLLGVTSAVIPIFKRLNTSPILGFLLTGTLFGPNGLNWVSDVHLMHVLGELGIVLFLFEMGLELSLDRLKKMKRDVFGLGMSQYIATAGVIASVARFL
jgi:hypothetical protein